MTRAAYGSHPDQHIEVRSVFRPRWTAVLLHGGYWRSRWAADLMQPLAEDLAGRGVDVWNVEYRRPDRHGWCATVADVADGLRAVAASTPVVVMGHSAGGQLGLRAAADATDKVRLAVSLAGVLDLEQADRARLSNGAVAEALGHRWNARNPDDVAASPRHRLPLGVRQVVAYGTADDPHLVRMSRDYAAAARAAGDQVLEVAAPGDHFDVIDPETPLWTAVLEAISTVL